MPESGPAVCITLAHAQPAGRELMRITLGMPTRVRRNGPRRPVCRRVAARPADDPDVDVAAAGDRGRGNGAHAHPGHGAIAAGGARCRPAIAPGADWRDRDAADRSQSRGVGRGAVDPRGEGRAVPHRTVAEGRCTRSRDGHPRCLACASRRGRQAGVHVRRRAAAPAAGRRGRLRTWRLHPSGA